MHDQDRLPRRIVLLGAPGSGKGSIGRDLAGVLGIPHVSSGQLLRATIAGGDPYGIGPRLADGGFAPDELVARIVGEQLGDGFILDGYPRTAKQAGELDELLARSGRPVEAVLDLEVPDDEIRRRLAHRASLENRADDAPETVEARLRTWHELEGDLKVHYEGLLRPVDGMGTPDEVRDRVLAALAGTAQPR
jgi:adenylate kinase